jgi:5-methylcytosine-specific restriction endonuclease McrA
MKLGLSSWCKSCCAEVARIRLAKYRETHPATPRKHNTPEQNAAKKQRRRDRVTKWKRRHKDVVAAYRMKRRALQKNIAAEQINPIDVFERDRWICGICGMPINRLVKYPQPDSPSIDHIVPIALGGSHTFDNVQAAHLYCNISKGTKLI